MTNVSERFRKVLRTVFRGVGVSVISLVIQACYGVMYPNYSGAYGMPAPAYGMPPNEDTLISGKVKARKTGEPILGIQVSIEETESSVLTDEEGIFNLWVPVLEEYKLKVEDIDGPDNGGLFKQQTWTLKQEDTFTTLLIGLDADTETDEE